MFELRNKVAEVLEGSREVCWVQSQLENLGVRQEVVNLYSFIQDYQDIKGQDLDDRAKRFFDQAQTRVEQTQKLAKPYKNLTYLTCQDELKTLKEYLGGDIQVGMSEVQDFLQKTFDHLDHALESHRKKAARRLKRSSSNDNLKGLSPKKDPKGDQPENISTNIMASKQSKHTRLARQKSASKVKKPLAKLSSGVGRFMLKNVAKTQASS